MEEILKEPGFEPGAAVWKARMCCGGEKDSSRALRAIISLNISILLGQRKLFN